MAVALEPYNYLSLSFLSSTHISGMFNFMRTRASVREIVVAVCESVRLSSGAVYCAVCRRNRQCSFCLDRREFCSHSENKRVSVETTGVGQECEASLVWSVVSVRSFVCS